MQFDVIIGNPPYQMKADGDCFFAPPIYHLFVEQALKLEPRFVSMVIPSRWMVTGRRLDEFRNDMLGSRQLLKLVNYPISKEVFSGVKIAGGICYFLWDSEHNGLCDVTLIRGDYVATSLRQLDEFDVFVRDARAIDILRKVLEVNEPSITDMLTPYNAFDIASNFDDFHEKKQLGDIPLYYVRSGKRYIGFIPRSMITKNAPLIDKWKVLVPKATPHNGGEIPYSVLGKPLISPPPSVSTLTFTAFCVATKEEAQSLESYYRTQFFRYLVSLRKITQNAFRSMYSWVPMQSWDREWTDEMLYEKYGITKQEQGLIESMVKPMRSL